MITMLIFGVAIYYIEKWGCPHDIVEEYGYYVSSGYVAECRSMAQGWTNRNADYGELLCCVVQPEPQTDLALPFKVNLPDPTTSKYVAQGYTSILQVLILDT